MLERTVIWIAWGIIKAEGFFSVSGWETYRDCPRDVFAEFRVVSYVSRLSQHLYLSRSQVKHNDAFSNCRRARTKYDTIGSVSSYRRDDRERQIELFAKACEAPDTVSTIPI